MTLDPIGSTATATPGAYKQQLREASEQFESLFLGQMMEAMRRSAPKGGILPSSSGQEMFRQMFDQEIAQRMAQTGGIGVGEIIYRQLAPPAQEATPGGAQE